MTWSVKSATCLGRWAIGGAMGLLAAAGSCIDVQLGGDGIDLGLTSSFIVSGTMEIDERGRECSRFQADTGVTYHLFQGSKLTIAEFDLLFEDGSRSRLELKVRTDLILECASGVTVEAVSILEFIPADQVD